MLAFVEDKDKAIGEMTRVLRPGGCLNLNETCWLPEPPAGQAQKADPAGMLGTRIPTADRWREVWNASGLEEAEVRVREVDASEEVRSRISWIGGRQILTAWSRIISMYLTRPAMRTAIKATMDTPREWYAYVGLALMAGRKAAAGS